MLLIGLCCGSADVELGMFGVPKLFTYQGGKGRYRRAIYDATGLRRPDAVALIDAGPWGLLWEALSQPARRDRIADWVERMYANRDARVVFDELRGSTAPAVGSDYFFAQLLVLQRLAILGRPVWVEDGVWRSRGLDTASAYGRPKSKGWSGSDPLLPKLPAKIRAVPEMPIAGHMGDLREVDPKRWVQRGRTIAYLDPPYSGTTAYDWGDLQRDEVIAIAQRWYAAGAEVVISEGESLDLPGWRTVEITKGRRGKVSTHGKARKGREWLTMSPGVGVASDGLQLRLVGCA